MASERFLLLLLRHVTVWAACASANVQWSPKEAHPEVYVAVADGPAYLRGVQSLAASLLRSNSTRALWVLIQEPPSEELKASAACLGFQLLLAPIINVGEIATDAKGYNHTLEWARLNAWRLPARRVIFLDADVIVLKNIDHLFEPGPAFRAHSASRYLNPEGWVKKNVTFNVGVAALTPSIATFNDMMHRIPELGTEEKFRTSQRFLQLYYNDEWLNNPEMEFGREYNTLKRLEPLSSDFSLEDVYVIHNVGTKPWWSNAQDDKYPKSHGAYYTAINLFKTLSRQCATRQKLYGQRSHEPTRHSLDSVVLKLIQEGNDEPRLVPQHSRKD